MFKSLYSWVEGVLQPPDNTPLFGKKRPQTLTACQDNQDTGRLPCEGSTVGGYNVLQAIGAGLFSTVYEGVRINDGAPCALKIIPRTSSKLLRSEKRRFPQQVLNLGGVEHENVVSLMDVKNSTTFVMLVMSLCNGGSLRRYVQILGRPLMELEIQPLAIQLCRAVQFLNSSGVVHGNVVSDNVLLTTDGMIKLCGFGLSSIETKMSVMSDKVQRKKNSTGHFKQCVIPRYGEGFRRDAYMTGILLFSLFFMRNPTVLEIERLGLWYEKRKEASPLKEVTAGFATVLATLLRQERRGVFEVFDGHHGWLE